MTNAHRHDEQSGSVAGGALSVAPLRQRRDGRPTLVNEGLTGLSWDDRTALTHSEWLVQTDA